MSSDTIYFWKHYHNHGHLCNWYNSHFVLHNQTFSNMEVYMMWRKAKLFNDEDMARQILNSQSPSMAKKLGRSVKNFDESKWDENKEEIVYTGCLAKYTQNPELKKKLLETGNNNLVEASPYDKVWGIGLNERLAKTTPQNQWPGQNLLGICLMKVRHTIKEL